MEENVETKAATGGGGGGGGKVVPILLVMNTLIMAGVLFMVMRKPAPAAHAAAAATAAAAGEQEGLKKEGDAPGPIFKLENFIIQLKTADAERYVRVAFDLELKAVEDKDPVTARLSLIRDAIISYFSDRTLDELRGSAGMERTKEALLKKFDELVPGRRVKAIFITDFVVQ